MNEAYGGAAATYTFYKEAYDRDSVDGSGLALVSCVHFGVDFDNAFWDGGEMVYGDGSHQLFIVGSLTKAIDVIGHELTHGVTQYTAGLEYHGQSGALNESCSDVFGSLVKQYSLGQSADQADWLNGAGLLVPEMGGQALRSMSNPGTAFDGDPQPAHMDDYQDLPDDNDPRNDNGGVHINSGIPNRAFYLAATAIGGNAWEGRTDLVPDAHAASRVDVGLRQAADATVEAAADLFERAGVRSKPCKRPEGGRRLGVRRALARHRVEAEDHPRRRSGRPHQADRGRVGCASARRGGQAARADRGRGPAGRSRAEGGTTRAPR